MAAGQTFQVRVPTAAVWLLLLPGHPRIFAVLLPLLYMLSILSPETTRPLEESAQPGSKTQKIQVRAGSRVWWSLSPWPQFNSLEKAEHTFEIAGKGEMRWGLQKGKRMV